MKTFSNAATYCKDMIKKITIRHIAAFFGLLMLGFVGGYYAFFSPETKLEISLEQSTNIGKLNLAGFEQDKEHLTIIFNRPVRMSYLLLNHVPTSLDLDGLKGQAKDFPVSAALFSIPFDGESTDGEYSILIFLDDGYVELVRQSEQWLDKTFGYKRSGGYTILGRRTINVSKGSVEITSDTLKLVGKPDLMSIQPISISKYSEINLAAGLLSTLWSKPIQQGPTSKSYSDFLMQPFEEKMRRVRVGDFAVMCSGFRDLFAHASIGIPDLKVRLIEAVNYAPQFPDLITYGHSTTEVWVQELAKWVLFDPWLGIIIVENGLPLGAEELSKIENIEQIRIIPVIDQVPRMYIEKSGEEVFNKFIPSNVKVTEFSCEKLSCAPGYVEYFRNYKVRDVVLQR
jgi:hypothetical protein